MPCSELEAGFAQEVAVEHVRDTQDAGDGRSPCHPPRTFGLLEFDSEDLSTVQLEADDDAVALFISEVGFAVPGYSGPVVITLDRIAVIK